MSAVTLQEIAELVALKRKVTIADMRGIAKRRMSEFDKARAMAARDVAIILAWRHTQSRLGRLGDFFAFAEGGSRNIRINEIIERGSTWIAGDPPLAADVEAIEQIDALHDRRMRERDRKQGVTA